MTPEFPTEHRSKYELWFTHWMAVSDKQLRWHGLHFPASLRIFPNIKIVTHHCGAMIPMLEGRTENGLKMYGGRTAPELREELTKTKLHGDPIDTFRKFYADTAGFGSASAIRAGLDFFGKDHMVFATDMPFDPEKGPGYISRTLDNIDSLGLDDDTKAAILHGNAERIFHV